MTLNKNGDMYNSINYDFQHIFNTFDVNNRLLCTFIALEGLDGLINEVIIKFEPLGQMVWY